MSWCVVPCSEGDTFRITGTGAERGRLWAFINSSGNILARETTVSTPYTNLKLVAPANTAYLVANARIDSPKMLLSGERTFLNDEDARIIYDETELHPNKYPTIGYTINSSNVWQVSSYVKCSLIPISKNAEYKIINNTASEGYIAFLKDGWYSSNDRPHFATGETGRIIIPANGGKYTAIPAEDAEILVVQVVDRYSQNTTPNITIKEIASTAKTIVDNMTWSWWIYPTMQTFSRIRDKLYWTFTTATGDSGIASYDYRSKITKRTVLKHTDDVDDHCGIAMKVLASGKIICAYSTGHNEDKFMHVVTAMLLTVYLENRKDDLPALFIGKGSSRMTPGGIRKMLSNVAKRAGVENVHPHRFRRTLATNLINRGMSIQEVASILGHENINTTMTYVYVDKINVKNNYRRYT